jgi:hypothetical protein
MAVVYAHMKKDSREIYYIGIGNDINRAYHTGARSEIWKRYYKKYGLIVDILCSDIDIDSAKELEKFLIAHYGKKQLCNRTDGGEGFFGGKHTEETKKKISEQKKGKKASEETKIKLSLKSKGHQRRKKGTWSQSEETKAKIGKAFKGKKRSQFFCDQVKKSKVGYRPAKSTLDASVASRRDKAMMVIEVTTGFIGKPWEVCEKYNINRSELYKKIKSGKPFLRGRNKGLIFKKITT